MQLIVVSVNTVVLKTKLKIKMKETDTVRNLMTEVSKRIGETFLN